MRPGKTHSRTRNKDRNLVYKTVAASASFAEDLSGTNNQLLVACRAYNQIQNLT